MAACDSLLFLRWNLYDWSCDSIIFFHVYSERRWHIWMVHNQSFLFIFLLNFQRNYSSFVRNSKPDNLRIFFVFKTADCKFPITFNSIIKKFQLIDFHPWDSPNRKYPTFLYSVKFLFLKSCRKHRCEFSRYRRFMDLVLIIGKKNKDDESYVD